MNWRKEFQRPLPWALAGGMLAASTMFVARAASEPLVPEREHSLAELEGEWHVLAHIPYFLENNRVAPTIRYTRRDDDRWDEVYTARKGGFDAPEKSFRQVTWAQDADRPWRLTTRILYLFRARYSILDVDERAGIALLGSDDRDKAWIFARTPTLSDAAYRRALQRFAGFGFDPNRIKRIAQRPAELGAPGYARVDD